MATVIAASYLLLVIGLPIGVTLLGRYRSLPTGPLCPRCLGETFWIQGPLLGRLRLRSRPVLQRRWCPECRWVGLARPEVAKPERAGRPAATTVDLRAMQLNGSAVRVLLRCRPESRTWHGRLIFVTAQGESRSEDVEAFHGSSVSDVLAQALALPEHSLARRLRQALSG